MKRKPARILRDQLIREQNNRCHYCRCVMLPAGVDHDRAVTLDHIVPVSRGGEHKHVNTVAACRKCNIAKADALLKPKRRAKKPDRIGEPSDAAIQNRRERRKVVSALKRWQASVGVSA